MSKEKATPTRGPWKHDETWGLIVAPDGSEVAACHAGKTGSKTETKANARLIAAAPEMLEQLKYVTQVLKALNGKGNGDPIKTDALVKECEAVISKAEGGKDV